MPQLLFFRTRHPLLRLALSLFILTSLLLQVYPLTASAEEEVDFSDRPQRSWPIYYHRKYSDTHDRYVFGPLWYYENDDGGVSNYPVWPFLGYKSGPEKTVDLVWPFTGYEQQGERKRFSLIRPFTELKTTGGRVTTADPLWPFMGYETSPYSTRLRLLWPFTEYREQSGNEHLDLLWPFAGSQHETRPVSTFDRTTKKYVTHQEYENFRYLLRPLIGWREAGEEGKPPREESLCLAPLYCNYRTPGSDFTFAAPSFFWGDDQAGKSSWSTFLPLYFRSASPQKRRLFVFPSFYSGSTVGKKMGKGGGEMTEATSMLLPLYYSSEGDASSLYVFPTFWRSSETTDGKTASDVTSALPFFHFQKDAQSGERNFFFPSLIWGEGSETNYSGVLPFYYRNQEKDDRLLYVFPSYYSRQSDRYRTVKAIPFYTSTDDKGEGERYTSVVWPLYYHRENEAKETFYTSLFWPVYIAKKEEDRTETRSLLAPIYYSSGNERLHTAYRTILWPFFIEKAEAEYSETAFLGHVYFDSRSPREHRTDLLPFYSFSEDKDKEVTTMWPLLTRRVHQKQTGNTTWNSLIPLSVFSKIPPLYYRDYNEAKRYSYTTVLWPLTAFEEDPSREKVRVWPYSYEYDRVANFRSYHLLWPLFSAGSGPEETTARALPLFSYTRGPGFGSTFILPGYWNNYDPESSSTVFFPVYWNHTDPAGSRTTVPPFTWKSSPLSGESSFTMLPFLHLEREREHRRTLVAPFYYSDWRPSASSLFLMPFYWNWEKGGASTTVIPPLAWSADAQKSSFGLFPLYYGEKTNSSNLHVLLNTYWGEEPGSSYHGFAPLFFQWSNPDGDHTVVPPFYRGKGSDGSGRFVLFPFWWQSSTAQHSSFTLFPLMHYEQQQGGSQEFSLLWRMYYHKSAPEESKTVGLFWLYQDEDRPGYRLSKILPLYEYEHRTSQGRDETYFSMLFDLFKHRRVNDKEEVRIFFIPVYRR